jgi:hypothetical protein
MSKVSVEIVEPYEKQGNDVVVKIKECISCGGMPVTERFLFLRIKDGTQKSDKHIQQIVMDKIQKHLEELPDAL